MLVVLVFEATYVNEMLVTSGLWAWTHDHIEVVLDAQCTREVCVLCQIVAWCCYHTLCFRSSLLAGLLGVCMCVHVGMCACVCPLAGCVRGCLQALPAHGVSFVSCCFAKQSLTLWQSLLLFVHLHLSSIWRWRAILLFFFLEFLCYSSSLSSFSLPISLLSLCSGFFTRSLPCAAVGITYSLMFCCFLSSLHLRLTWSKKALVCLLCFPCLWFVIFLLCSQSSFSFAVPSHSFSVSYFFSPTS